MIALVTRVPTVRHVLMVLIATRVNVRRSGQVCYFISFTCLVDRYLSRLLTCCRANVDIYTFSSCFRPNVVVADSTILITYCLSSVVARVYCDKTAEARITPISLESRIVLHFFSCYI